ncbi:MAG: 50S ribosomal protein L32, partial [Lachnospiraceae bacterium]|nr:50S ribosomal protein L32 [Lachnospiraceae bacterium]
CGALMEPHKVCRTCGYYQNKSVVSVDE